MGHSLMAHMVTGQLGAEGPYWDALSEGQLLLPSCRDCGTWHWPAVWRCGACGSWQQDWHELRLTGSVFTWTRTHHRFGGTEGLALPYVTALVSLADVPVRLQGLIEGDEADLHIGAAVTGRIDRTRFGDEHIPSIRWSLA
jgi:uncharacterized protein